eukprot:gene16257-5888_t
MFSAVFFRSSCSELLRAGSAAAVTSFSAASAARLSSGAWVATDAAAGKGGGAGPPPAKRSAKLTFTDRCRLHVKGGPGGQGQKSRSRKGGDGGDVLIQSDGGVSCLAGVASGPRRLHAKPGENAATRRVAEKGADVIIRVPLGTVVTADSVVTLAHGGEGGSALTNLRHNGFAGDSVTVDMELKSIADVGLVGFPNAGKSSLMADIPGLIEGAAQNLGMGHSFLRHIERTRVLLYVVDVTGFQLNQESDKVTAGQALSLLANELDLYQPGLHQRPGLLAVNKLDVPGSKELYNELKHDLRGLVNDAGLNIQT